MTKFAHMYDMRQVLKECEAYLVQQVATHSKLFSQPGATVRLTLLAEKCELSTFLAHCELFMAKKNDESFWSTPEENAAQLSGDSMLRMLKCASWKNRSGKHIDLPQMIKWQLPAGTPASNAKDEAKMMDEEVDQISCDDEISLLPELVYEH